MPETTQLLTFALICLGMVLTPGPNMIYLISRSISQGRAAGLISLCGIALGFIVYMLCAAYGLTALLMAVPYAFDAIRLAGAAYLFWLAWQALRPGGTAPFVATWLISASGNRLAPAIYITLIAAMALLVTMISPETSGRRFDGNNRQVPGTGG